MLVLLKVVTVQGDRVFMTMVEFHLRNICAPIFLSRAHPTDEHNCCPTKLISSILNVLHEMI